jgi:hypothetical protein
MEELVHGGVSDKLLLRGGIQGVTHSTSPYLRDCEPIETSSALSASEPVL